MTIRNRKSNIRDLKKVIIVPDKCDGCGECEKACAARFGGRPYRPPRRVRREPSGGNARACKTGHVPQSRIRVERVSDAFVPLLCFHCDDAPCVEVCISGAMRRDARTGLVLLDEKQCVGCWSCVMVCPFGVIKPDFTNHKSIKCDGCAGRRIPDCAGSCQPQALLFQTPHAFSVRRARSRLAARAGMYRHGASNPQEN